jgi:hypothetical protein
VEEAFGVMVLQSRWWAALRRAAATFSAIGVLLVAGCSLGTNDSDDAATPTLEATRPATQAPAASPTARPSATPTPVPTATAPPPTATASPTVTPTATVTPVPEQPLGEIRPLDPLVLTNYSLAFALRVVGVPGEEDLTTTLNIEQSDPQTFHLLTQTGDTSFESWQVGGTTYLRQGDGTVVALPEGSDSALFSPALLVQTIPPLDSNMSVTRLGADTIEGRAVTHYRIDGEDYLAATRILPPDFAGDVRGKVDLWVDDEWRIALRLGGLVTWTNDDRTLGTLETSYDVTRILATPPVTAPA